MLRCSPRRPSHVNAEASAAASEGRDHAAPRRRRTGHCGSCASAARLHFRGAMVALRERPATRAVPLSANIIGLQQARPRGDRNAAWSSRIWWHAPLGAPMTCGWSTRRRSSAGDRGKPRNAPTWPGPSTGTVRRTPASVGDCVCTWCARCRGCRWRVLGMLDADPNLLATHPGQTLMADKNYYGAGNSKPRSPTPVSNCCALPARQRNPVPDNASSSRCARPPQNAEHRIMPRTPLNRLQGKGSVFMDSA